MESDQEFSTKRQHDAPGTVSGIEYQFQRALYWLAHAPAHASVGIETGDDVFVTGGSREDVSEQDKFSARSSGHPFTDKSDALWRTLDIWLQQPRVGDRDKLFLLTTNRPVPDCLARRLGEAQTQEQITACIRKLRAIADDPPEGIKEFVERIKAQSEDELIWLIERVRLCDESVAGVEDLYGQIISTLHLHPDEPNPEQIVDSLRGWLSRRVIEKWLKRVPAWVGRLEFDRQLHSILRRLRRSRIRERAANLIPIVKEQVESAKAQNFVKHLAIIEIDEVTLENSIECYLRFGTERIRLTEVGEITDGDWLDFFTQLSERWHRVMRNNLKDKGIHGDVEIGKNVFRETADSGFRAHLAGEQTIYEYFTSGGYHRLADEDSVWWHPAFKERGNTRSGG